MSDVTRILSAIERGEPQAAAELLPLVYDQLQRLAAQKIALEKPGGTLSATGLVHEAYLRLVGGDTLPHWNGRGHFFAAAAEAMRRILVDNARRRNALKRGGHLERVDMNCAELSQRPSHEVLSVHEALDQLAAVDERAAQLVKLRYFAGFSIPECAELLGVSPRTADNLWAYARAWLAVELGPAN